jgi:hypothetical protein
MFPPSSELKSNASKKQTVDIDLQAVPLTLNGLRGDTSQKSELFIPTAVTSDATLLLAGYPRFCSVRS